MQRPDHCLNHLLPVCRPMDTLRPRGHNLINFVLPEFCTELHKHSFLANCLYKFLWLFCDVYCCVRLSDSLKKTTYLLTCLLTAAESVTQRLAVSNRCSTSNAPAFPSAPRTGPASGKTSISKDDFAAVPPAVGQPKALFWNALRGFIFVWQTAAALYGGPEHIRPVQLLCPRWKWNSIVVECESPEV